MNKEQLHDFVDDALEKALDKYRNDEIEYSDIAETAAELIEHQFPTYKVNWYCYWMEDTDMDFVGDSFDSVIQHCLNEKVVAYSVNQNDFDEGFVFVTIVCEK